LRVSGNLPAGLWDIEVRSMSPLEAAAGRQATIAALCGLFGITLLWVTERQEGWTLTCPHPRLTDMSELGGGMSIGCSKERLSACNITLGRLVKVLEPALGLYLRDETGLAGKYDITVPVTSAAAARRSLESEHGILCQPSAWDVEMVVLQMPDGAP
jgi:hypothetical protein